MRPDDRIEFVHPLFASAVYSSAPPRAPACSAPGARGCGARPGGAGTTPGPRLRSARRAGRAGGRGGGTRCPTAGSPGQRGRSQPSSRSGCCRRETRLRTHCGWISPSTSTWPATFTARPTCSNGSGASSSRVISPRPRTARPRRDRLLAQGRVGSNRAGGGSAPERPRADRAGRAARWRSRCTQAPSTWSRRPHAVRSGGAPREERPAARHPAAPRGDEGGARRGGRLDQVDGACVHRDRHLAARPARWLGALRSASSPARLLRLGLAPVVDLAGRAVRGAGDHRLSWLLSLEHVGRAVEVAGQVQVLGEIQPQCVRRRVSPGNSRIASSVSSAALSGAPAAGAACRLLDRLRDLLVGGSQARARCRAGSSGSRTASRRPVRCTPALEGRGRIAAEANSGWTNDPIVRTHPNQPCLLGGHSALTSTRPRSRCKASRVQERVLRAPRQRTDARGDERLEVLRNRQVAASLSRSRSLAISSAWSAIPPDACAIRTSVGRGTSCPAAPTRCGGARRRERPEPAASRPTADRVGAGARSPGPDSDESLDRLVDDAGEGELERRGGRGIEPLKVVDREDDLLPGGEHANDDGALAEQATLGGRAASARDSATSSARRWTAGMASKASVATLESRSARPAKDSFASDSAAAPQPVAVLSSGRARRPLRPRRGPAIPSSPTIARTDGPPRAPSRNASTTSSSASLPTMLATRESRRPGQVPNRRRAAQAPGTRREHA